MSFLVRSRIEDRTKMNLKRRSARGVGHFRALLANRAGSRRLSRPVGLRDWARLSLQNENRNFVDARIPNSDFSCVFETHKESARIDIRSVKMKNHESSGNSRARRATSCAKYSSEDLQPT